MIKLEQKFLTAYKNFWLQRNGGFWFKIPDAPTSRQVAKPFDAFAACDSRSFAFEAKSISGNASLKFSDLRQSQKDGLSRVAAQGWESFVLAYYHNTRQFMRVPYKVLEEKLEVQKGEFILTGISI